MCVVQSCERRDNQGRSLLGKIIPFVASWNFGNGLKKPIDVKEWLNVLLICISMK